MPRMDGKIAVITGGNSGIGLDTAKRYVEEGTYVFIFGRRQEDLDRAVEEMAKMSRQFKATSRASKISIASTQRSRPRRAKSTC